MSETYFPTFKKWSSIPWRSSFRNLFQRRITWQARLAHSELPEVVQDTIRSVVSQAGLTRAENLDVCNELIFHFEDGCGAGNSMEVLVQKFGEPGLAAKLIRRGKQRSRSVFQRVGRVLGWFCLVAVIGYVGLWMAFLSGQPSPGVDYVKSLNTSAIDSPENEKAWPIYREAWIEYGFSTQKFGTEIYQTGDMGVTTRNLAAPGDKDWAQAVAFLKSNEGMYDAFRAAAAKPVLGLELRKRYSDYDLRDLRAMSPGHFDPDGKLIEGLFDDSELSLLEKEVNELAIGTLLPHIQSFREMARHLNSDMRLAISEDDSARALQDIKAMFGLAGHAAEAKVLVCSLVGMAIADIALESVEIAVRDNPETFTIEQLIELKAFVEEFEIRSLVKFGGERAMFYDILQRLYTDDGNGDGRMTLMGQKLLPYVNGMCGKKDSRDNQISVLAHSAAGMPTSMFSYPSRKEMKDKFDQIMSETERRFTQPNAEPLDLESYFEEGELESSYSLLNLLIPDVDNIRSSTDLRIEEREAVLDFIDVEIAKRK